MNDAERLERLIDEIESSFPNSAPPYYRNVPIGDFGRTSLEVDFLFGKRWKELSLKLLREYSNSPFYLSSEAFKYYLPGYVLATLEAVDQETFFDEVVIESLFYMLSPFNPDGDISSLKKENIDALNISQKKAILHYLEYLYDIFPEEVEMGDLNTPLDYWRMLTESG